MTNWAITHETHILIAEAIHGLATPDRTVEEIWEDPTPQELADIRELWAWAAMGQPESEGVWGETTLANI